MPLSKARDRERKRKVRAVVQPVSNLKHIALSNLIPHEPLRPYSKEMQLNKKHKTIDKGQA